MSPCRGWWTNLTNIETYTNNYYDCIHPPLLAVVAEVVVHLVPNRSAVVLHVDEVPGQVYPLPGAVVSIHKYFVPRTLPQFLLTRFIWKTDLEIPPITFLELPWSPAYPPRCKTLQFHPSQYLLQHKAPPLHHQQDFFWPEKIIYLHGM